MEKRLSVRACVRYGWQTFKKRSWILVAATALVIVLSAIIPNADPKYGWALGIFVGVVSLLLTTLIELGEVNFSLEAHDDVEAVTIADLWRPELYLPFLGTVLIALVLTLIGFALLIVPGIIVSLMLCLATFLVVDRGLAPVEALKESRRLTKGHRWKLFQLFIVLALLNILGLLLLFVGLLVTLPVSGIALAHAYRTLSDTEKEPDVIDVEAHEVPVVPADTDQA